jgi:hypothetical protein
LRGLLRFRFGARYQHRAVMGHGGAAPWRACCVKPGGRGRGRGRGMSRDGGDAGKEFANRGLSRCWHGRPGGLPVQGSAGAEPTNAPSPADQPNPATRDMRQQAGGQSGAPSAADQRNPAPSAQARLGRGHLEPALAPTLAHATSARASGIAVATQPAMQPLRVVPGLKVRLTFALRRSSSMLRVSALIVRRASRGGGLPCRTSRLFRTERVAPGYPPNRALSLRGPQAAMSGPAQRRRAGGPSSVVHDCATLGGRRTMAAAAPSSDDRPWPNGAW